MSSVATLPTMVSRTTLGHSPAAPPPSATFSRQLTGLCLLSLTSNISDQYGPGFSSPPSRGADTPSPWQSVRSLASGAGTFASA